MLTVRARRLVLLLAALTALLVTGCAGVTTTSGSTRVGAQNRVWAFTPAAQPPAPPTTSQSSCSRPGFTAPAVGLASGFCVATEDAGAGAAETAGGGGQTFVTTPRGTTFDIPEGYVGREADNGAGIVYQEPGASGNAGSIRIMEPTGQYPDGYFRYYNSEGNGQPLDINGNPGPPSATHIPENYIGPVLGWPGG
jgi:hypothetical protein